MVDALALGMIVSVVSFLGFVVENIWLAAIKGYMDNRGMRVPFLIGYGVAVLTIYMIFGTPGKLWFFGKAIQVQNRIIKLFIYLAEVMLCVCIGEILLGTFVEKTCHFHWWDYSELPLHITRYTSIPTSIIYSILITVFMEIFFSPLYRFFRKLNSTVLCVVTVLSLTLMISDFICNACRMYRRQGIVRIWKISIGKQNVLSKNESTGTVKHCQKKQERQRMFVKKA